MSKETIINLPQGGKVEYKVNIANLLEETIYKIVKTVEDVVRELVSNEKDAGSKVILVSWDPKGWTLTVEGWGKGIDKIEEFITIGTDNKKQEMLKDPSKKISGRKGIGRLHALKICDKIEFLSNCPTTKYRGQVIPVGARIIFTSNDIPDTAYGDVDKFLPHVGVRVILHNVKQIYHKEMKNLTWKLSDKFAYALLKQDIDLRFNGERILAPKRYRQVFEQNDCKMTRYEPTDPKIVGEVDGIMIKDNKADWGSLTIYQNGAKVVTRGKSDRDKDDLNRKMWGFINVDGRYDLDADRNDYEHNDKQGIELDISIRKWLSIFETFDEGKSSKKLNARTIKFNHHIGSYFSNYLKKLGIGATIKVPKKEDLFMTAEGCDYDKRVEGTSEWTIANGHVSNNGTIAGGRPPNGRGGGGTNNVVIDPTTGEEVAVIAVNEIKDNRIPDKKIFNVKSIPKKPDRNERTTATTTSTPLVNFSHTNFDPMKFLMFNGNMGQPEIFINLKHPLHEEIFLDNGSYRPGEEQHFVVFFAGLMVEQNKDITTISEANVVTTNMISAMWRNLRNDGLMK